MKDKKLEAWQITLLVPYVRGELQGAHHGILVLHTEQPRPVTQHCNILLHCPLLAPHPAFQNCMYLDVPCWSPSAVG